MSVTLLIRVMEWILTPEVLAKKEAKIDCSEKWESLNFESITIENALILRNREVYVCYDIEKDIENKSVICRDFKALGLSTKEAFNINVFNPEQMLFLRRRYDRQFIVPEFNLDAFLDEVNKKMFIKYLVVSNTLLSDPNWVRNNLKDNYRVIEFDENSTVKRSVYYKNGKPLHMPSESRKTFYTKGLNLNEFMSINGNYFLRRITKDDSVFKFSMRDQLNVTGKKRVEVIDEMLNSISNTDYYAFNDFYDYWDIFFNSNVYSQIPYQESNDESELLDHDMDESVDTTNESNNDENKKGDSLLKPTNTILYGPPGTGKTYQTVNKAVELLDGEFYRKNSENRIALKKEFDDLVNEGRIVFTTFHQSMCYEDFIEGIKPILDENEVDNKQVGYEIEDGVFKKLCVEATFDLFKKDDSEIENSPIEFMDLYNNFVDLVEDKLNDGNDFDIYSKTGSKLIIKKIDNKRNIVMKHDNGTQEYTVSYANLLILHNKYPDLAKVDNMVQSFRKVSGVSNSTCHWAILNELQNRKLPDEDKSDKTYIYNDKKNMLEALTINNEINPKAENFVLIIDEINRGNVSQIFGELITLIEEDKRLGGEEALKVMLPYSKKEFGVPANLHIIGTMNTADRSVEALDTALRRRFTFEEIVPKPELIREHGQEFIITNGVSISLPKILETINNRLLILTDRDHLIGHSYFIKVTDLAGLREVMYNNVIPLLQEYFYGDYGKIGLVLGQGFIKIVDTKSYKLAEFNHYDQADYSERKVYDIVENLAGAKFVDAINILLYGKAVKPETDGSTTVDTNSEA